ncbi:MAG TPA: GNAT family N-acetyltransferase [Bradyrhizobium sp.]|jgi:GNAT superfamily N-acetyltransferase|nr:GNAT family N-acetyltransferase [Bradyrhizobium sp.]
MNADAPVAFGWARAARAGLTFRPIADADQSFLARVYASTRKDELAATSMSGMQKAALLLLQFRAQHAHFQKHYPQADRLVVMGGGNDIGRLYIARWPTRHGIIDITLLPEYRRHGAGEVLLRDLMDEAAACGKSVSILVEKHNPAMRLCRRLGFVAEEDKGVHDLMRWTSQPSS